MSNGKDQHSTENILTQKETQQLISEVKALISLEKSDQAIQQVLTEIPGTSARINLLLKQISASELEQTTIESSIQELSQKAELLQEQKDALSKEINKFISGNFDADDLRKLPAGITLESLKQPNILKLYLSSKRIRLKQTESDLQLLQRKLTYCQKNQENTTRKINRQRDELSTLSASAQEIVQHLKQAKISLQNAPAAESGSETDKMRTQETSQQKTEVSDAEIETSANVTADPETDKDYNQEMRSQRTEISDSEIEKAASETADTISEALRPKNHSNNLSENHSDEPSENHSDVLSEEHSEEHSDEPSENNSEDHSEIDSENKSSDSIQPPEEASDTESLEPASEPLKESYATQFVNLTRKDNAELENLLANREYDLWRSKFESLETKYQTSPPPNDFARDDSAQKPETHIENLQLTKPNEAILTHINRYIEEDEFLTHASPEDIARYSHSAELNYLPSKYDLDFEQWLAEQMQRPVQHHFDPIITDD
ncbi:MAG: hypothetical protein LBV19_09655 [Streptococcaceae bacterium]|nr:hypothetical protein [Streptococcaceae bacterium]